MAIRATCYVTGSIEGGPAFAIRKDNDEGVFIPTKTAEKLQLMLLDEVDCLLIPNEAQPENTPWFAQIVNRVTP